MVARAFEQQMADRRESMPAILADRRLVVLVYALLGLAALFPLAVVDIPLLVDLPNHLARLHIIGNIDRDAALAANYKVVWGAKPNLAMEIVVAPLAGLLPVEVLGRLFIAVTFALLTAGTLALRRVLYGRVDLWPAAAYLFLYNHLLIMGFLNYLFGLGLALLLFAAWIGSRSHAPLIRLALFSGALIVLNFAHLFALAVYGVCVATYEIGTEYRRLSENRRKVAERWLLAALQFLPIGILVFVTMPDTPDREILYGTFANKVRALWSPTLTYQTPIDLALFLFAAGVLAVGLVRRKLALAPPLRGPLLVLVPLAAATPFWIHGAWGSVAYIDLRLPLAVALLLVAGLKLRDVRRETLAAVTCAALVLFGARIVDVTLEWRRADREFTEFRAAIEAIPPGAALLPVQKRNAHFETGIPRFEYAYWHLAALAVIDRSVFMPFLFTDPAKQPVVVAPSRAAIDVPFGAPIDYAQLVDGVEGGGEDLAPLPGRAPGPPFWSDWPQHYEYVLLTHFGVAGNPLPGLLAPLREGSFFTLYRVEAGQRQEPGTAAAGRPDGKADSADP